jgi:carboxymethylenebutenolidase
MKQILLVLLSILNPIFAASQSCCQLPLSAASGFKDFASTPSFRNAHAAPLPKQYSPTIGQFVYLKTGDGKEARVFEVKSGQSKGNTIFLFHEWWGLNDYILQEAERLHGELGATILALDLYDGKITSDPTKAAKLMQSLDEKRVRSIIDAAIDYVGKFGKIQPIGWCMGGGWALQAALMSGARNYGCVVYYGMPETDTSRLATLEGPVLGIYAKQDEWITPELVSEFESAMQKTGKKLTVYTYDAAHAFANPSNPKFNKAARDDARQKAVEFLKTNFEVPLRKVPESEVKTKQ